MYPPKRRRLKEEGRTIYIYSGLIVSVLVSNRLTLWKPGKLSLGAEAGGSGSELWGFTGSCLLVDTLEFLADTLDTSST